MSRKSTTVVLLTVLLLGAALVVGAGLVSREQTGEWMGYPLPNEILALGGVGLLLLTIGVMGLLAFSVLVFADWPPIRRVLSIQVVSDEHFLARVGRGILRANHAWHMFQAALLLAILLGAGVYMGGSYGTLLIGIVIGFLAVVLYARYVARSGERRSPTTP